MNGLHHKCFSCGHRVLRLFYHNLEGAHEIKRGQKPLKLIFFLISEALV